MKFNTISYTLFFFVIIRFFPSLIYASWTVANPPQPPQDDFQRNCVQWIYYSGFTLDNYTTNRAKALSRNVMKDHLASTWAAIYAFKIGGRKDIYQILPQDFCNSFGPDNLVPMEFKTLESESRTCLDWIILYGFSEDNFTYNFTYAMNFDVVKMSYISLWAYSYWVFIWYYKGQFRVTPLELCILMGKSVGMQASPMPFTSEHKTILTCRDWIYLFDYTDNPRHNLFKAVALNNANSSYPIRIHYFPCNYAIELLKLRNSGQTVNHLTPLEFCKKHDGDGNEPRKYNLSYDGK